MESKDNQFTLVKQAAYVEYELKGMEKSFEYMFNNFGDAAAVKLFREKKSDYSRWSAIKESLDQLTVIQENLNRTGEGLFEKLCTKALSESEILDAFISSNSKSNKK